MSWIYMLKDNISLNTHWNNGIKYFPVKKKYTPMFSPITLWRKYKDTEGICGLGEIIEYEAIKSTEIKLNENTRIYDKSYFQIKIKTNTYTPEGLFIDKEILKQFPAYNRKCFDMPLNPYTLYFDGGLNYSVNYIYHNYHSDFFSISYIDKNLWKYFIHILREREIRNYWKRILLKKYKECFYCGFKSEVKNFFELHDNVIVDFDKDFVPVNLNDFSVLCPNCHKLIHHKMKNEGKQ